MANVLLLSGSLTLTDGGTDSEVTTARIMVTMANKASRLTTHGEYPAKRADLAGRVLRRRAPTLRVSAPTRHAREVSQAADRGQGRGRGAAAGRRRDPAQGHQPQSRAPATCGTSRCRP